MEVSQKSPKPEKGKNRCVTGLVLKSRGWDGRPCLNSANSDCWCGPACWNVLQMQYIYILHEGAFSNVDLHVQFDESPDTGLALHLQHVRSWFQEYKTFIPWSNPAFCKPSRIPLGVYRHGLLLIMTFPSLSPILQCTPHLYVEVPFDYPGQ